MIPLTYILINLFHAVWHKYLTDRNRLILSGQKVIEYLTISVLAGLILNIGFGCPVAPLIFFCVLSRLAFFDGFLNILRGKSVLYEGEVKKNKSLWDYLENKIGLPVWFYRIFYLVAFIAYLIIYYL